MSARGLSNLCCPYNRRQFNREDLQLIVISSPGSISRNAITLLTMVDSANRVKALMLRNVHQPCQLFWRLKKGLDLLGTTRVIYPLQNGVSMLP